MTPVIQLINGQDLGFDDHRRGMEHFNIDCLHMHKRFHGDKYSKAEIRIYFDEACTWEAKGTRKEELEKELREVFDRLSSKEQASFFQQVDNALSEYYRSFELDKDKDEFLKRIVMAIWGKEFHVLRSSRFKTFKSMYSKSFEIDTEYQELKYICKGKKYKIIFHKNGKIEIQDITDDIK